jgi:hypothetical protein
MAKKSKDTSASTAKKEAKVKVPVDPVTAKKNLVRLLNILALLLAITAFVLQFLAVITHAWKHQVTNLKPLFSPNDRPSTQAYVSDDSRIDQRYGLFTRDVKVYANNDEQLDVWGSTRFPRIDNGDGDLHICLSRTSTLRGSLLTCANRLNSPQECHCRRYPHWNAIIFFEIAALILLGLVVLASALLTTQYRGLLKLIGAALSFLAFLFLLVGLIVLLSYLKRETRTIADAYPHDNAKFNTLIGQRYQSVLHKAVRREAHETYRAYSLSPGQHPYNQTHFQQYSEQENKWVYLPYSSLSSAAYAPRSQGTAQRTTTARPLRNAYGPLIGYDEVYENTRACIGWSAVLSILALILSLLLPLILAFSWLKGDKPGPDSKTTTTITTVETGYIPVPQDATHETVPLNRSTEQVVIRDDQPTTTTQTTRT